MKALTKIIGALLIILAIALIVAIFLPSKQSVSSGIEINAEVSKAFEQVNTMSNWSNWSPFQEADTSLIIRYEGAKMGVGAIQKWGRAKEDMGILTIKESQMNQSIKNHIDFIDQGEAYGYWTFEQKENKAYVKWEIEMVELSYPVMRIMGLFLESMMQETMDNGLYNIKYYIEDEAASNPYNIVQTNFSESASLSMKDSCSWDQISVKTEEMFTYLYTYLGKNSIQPSSYPYANYLVWDEEKQFTVFEISVPVGENVTSNDSKILNTLSPSGKVIKGIHKGAYENTYNLYMAMDEYMKNNSLSQIGGPWEVFITDSTVESDTSKWVTEVYFPIN